MPKVVNSKDLRGPDEYPRLSNRYRIDGLEIRWSPRSGRLIASSKGKEVPAKVIDISIAGALIIAPSNRHIEAGMRIPVRIGASNGTAEVRNIRSSTVPDMSFYGIVFTQMSDGFTDNVNVVVGRLRSGPNSSREIPQK